MSRTLVAAVSVLPAVLFVLARCQGHCLYFVYTHICIPHSLAVPSSVTMELDMRVGFGTEEFLAGLSTVVNCYADAGYIFMQQLSSSCLYTFGE